MLDHKRANQKYVIITPVRDEEQFVEECLKSVTSQTIKPRKWIIINDGSTDGTRQIIEKYLKEHSWIQLVNLEDKGVRKPGGEYVLHIGFDMINIDDYEYIVRLDADLSFEKDFFEELFIRFSQDPSLGIASGVCYIPVGHKLIEEVVPAFHTRGGNKVYRRNCLKQIGNIEHVMGFDTVDEVKANMLGWRTQGFRELRVIHHRRTGSAKGILKGKINGGKSAYFASYHPLFMIVRGLWRMKDKPYIISGLALMYGFFLGYILRLPQVDDPDLIRYLRKQQMNKLLLRHTIWK